MKSKLLLSIISFTLVALMATAQNPQIWGTTQYGGAFSEGTIFSMNADGSNFSTEYNFTWPGGWMPMGNLLFASDGNIYGTCYEGGDYASCTEYRYEPSTGNYTDVYSFDIIHGDYPTSGLIERNGILYGNSFSGGMLGGGVLYSYDISTETYSDFYDLPSGSYPYSAPIIAGDGNLYGTNTGAWNGYGSIYKYDLYTNDYEQVYDFDQTNGSHPYGGLLQADNGKFYGMTFEGGDNGDGVLYSFDPSDNTFEALYHFDNSTGGNPKGTLMQSSDGKLYGLTTGGGANNHGTIFSFDLTDNTYEDLFDFSNSDGSAPLGNLMKTGFLLCGTTSAGGDNSYGTVFTFNLETGNFTKLLDFDGTNGQAPSGGFITLGDYSTHVEPVATAQLSIYPNPVSDYALVTLAGVQSAMADVIVTDVLGKEILSLHTQITNSHVQVDFAELASGVYNVEVLVGNERKSMKVVKE